MATACRTSFAALGVGITVESNHRGHLQWIASRLDSLLPGYVEPLGERPVAHAFSILAARDGTVSLLLDGEEISARSSPRGALPYLGARIKLAVAGSATAHLVVHAGVVGLGGRAVVLPAHSVRGKTTLVRELVRRGAVYYSDDFAIIDSAGRVLPFAKTLSLRGQAADPYRQVEVPVETLGGVRGTGPIPVGLVLFTGFSPDAVWAPQAVSPGRAVLRLVEHTLNVRTQPLEAMTVLGRAVGEAAVLWESPRGDAAEVAEQVVARMRAVAFGTSLC